MIRAFALLGRRAAPILAVSVFVGLLIPPLAELCRPFLLPALFVPLMVALIRLDVGLALDYARRPWLVLALVVGLMGVAPVVVHGVVRLLGVDEAIATGVVLMATAAPLMAAPAFALILGLDVALATVAATAATLVAPFTIPPLALLLLGLELNISAGALFLRLAGIVGGALAGALLCRRLIPASWLRANAQAVDGFAVFWLAFFAVGVMAGVTAKLFAEPGYVLGCLAASLIANPALQVAGALAGVGFDWRQRLTLGLVAGNRNMALVLIALADRAPFEIVVFFAVAQVPMYLMPLALQRVARRLRRPPGSPDRN
ncbi:MAG: hypothetical protein EXQ96_09500 [Alphaproteobacteria bacterium]|nr:hypothetical protein [Alphaproteobacteria bacterium]